MRSNNTSGKNAPAAWKQYRTKLQKVQVSFEACGVGCGEGQLIRNGDYRKMCVSNFHEGDIIVGQNLDYRFAIHQKGGDQWVLDDCVMLDEVPKDEQKFNYEFRLQKKFDLIATELLLINEVPIHVLADPQRFQVNDISTVELEDGTFVRLDFTYTPGTWGVEWLWNGGEFDRSVVWLDPENNWLIRKSTFGRSRVVFEQSAPEGGYWGFRTENTFFRNVDNRQCVRQLRCWEFVSSDKSKEGWVDSPTLQTLEFEFAEDFRLDFWLSHYGIEEPDFVSDEQSHGKKQ